MLRDVTRTGTGGGETVGRRLALPEEEPLP